MTEVDPDIEHLRGEIIRIDARLNEIEFERGWHFATVELRSLPSWLKMVEFLRDKAVSDIERLTRTRLDPYDQGYAQGRLAALRLVSAPKPLQQQALDSMELETQNLREQRAELEHQLRADFRIR